MDLAFELISICENGPLGSGAVVLLSERVLLSDPGPALVSLSEQFSCKLSGQGNGSLSGLRLLSQESPKRRPLIILLSQGPDNLLLMSALWRLCNLPAKYVRDS